MANFLFHLGRWSYRHKWRVIIGWLLILGLLGVGAASLQRGFRDQYSIPGTQSQAAVDMLLEHFPEAEDPLNSASVTLVFVAPKGHTLAEPDLSNKVQQTVDRLEQAMPGLIPGQRSGNPVTQNQVLQDLIISETTKSGLPEEAARADAENLAMLSKDGRIGFTTYSLTKNEVGQVTPEQRAALNETLAFGRGLGLTVEASGSPVGEALEIKPTSEVVGIAVAFLTLLLVFGSVIAAGLPLLNALVGVGFGVLTVLIATRFFALDTTTPVLSVMLGLAVGIDYALFIVSRYRTEYHRAPRDEAAGLAVGTAGSAVVFAGITVVTALLALAVANIPFLTYMGVAAAITVTVSVLVALTMVPALIGVTGKFTFGVRIPGLGGNPWRRHKQEGAARPLTGTEQAKLGLLWARLLQKIPGLVVAVVVVGLGVLTLPVLHLEMALPNDSTADLKDTQRKAVDYLAEGFGPGINAPFLVIADASNVNPNSALLYPLVSAQTASGADPVQAARQAAWLQVISSFSSNTDVKHAQILAQSEDGTTAEILLTPMTSPADATTVSLLGALRQQQAGLEAATGIKIGITGLAPIQSDITAKLSEVMPLYLGIVVGLAIFLLLLVFRSIVIPLIAAAGFLLSIGASFGVTVAVWQDGFGSLVSTPGPIISFMPIFLIGVTFGLAMDYQVFLTTRMREHYTRHHDVAGSIINGFALSGRVVFAAAFIMVSVFVAFIDQEYAFVKIFGFALAAGVLFDSFIIRMTFVPAAMFLLGRANWWMPRWLDRLLPTVDVEGEALEKAAAQRRQERAAAKKAQLAGLIASSTS